MSSLQSLDLQQLPLISITSGRKLCRRRRKVHHKVKTGCKACKTRRQKCDERVPICSGCERYSTECTYPIQDRPSAENVTPAKTNSLVRNARSSSPAVGLSAPQTADLDLSQLELWHQFLTSTSIAPGQKPEMTLQFQRTIFTLAQAYPFVMRGIFAMAATHLSWLRPSRQSYYTTIATKNHNDALPDFQSTLPHINKDNCHAVIFYSKSLLWCAMAGLGNTNAAMKIGNNWLPQWFWLLRGSCQLVESSRNWLIDGPHVEYGPDIPVDCSKSPDDDHIVILMSQLLLMTGSTLCQNVLSSLREAFARATWHHHSTPVRNAMNFWVGSLSEEYIQLLQNKEPWTMVALAHFCVLVHRFETLWFMKGHATSLLLVIAESLDKDWRHLVQWPHQELEIQPPS